jgi:hypothetical protein
MHFPVHRMLDSRAGAPSQSATGIWGRACFRPTKVLRAGPRTPDPCVVRRYGLKIKQADWNIVKFLKEKRPDGIKGAGAGR